MMYPVITIVFTFICMIGFVMFGTLAIGAWDDRRRVIAMALSILAALSAWGVSVNADATMATFIERTEQSR